MHQDHETRSFRAIKSLLVSIARMLIRFNVDCRQFVDLAKLAFVEAATEDYGIRDRKTNVSRVSVMTGLIRKEVTTLRQRLETGEDISGVPESLGQRILDGWHTTDRYLTSAGEPAPLFYYADESAASFCRLVEDFGVDVPPGAYRTELKRVGAVDVSQSNTLTARRHCKMTVEEADRLVEALTTLELAARSVEFNTRIGEVPWPQARETSAAVDVRELPKFRRVFQRLFNESVGGYRDVLTSYDTLSGGSPDDPDQVETVIRVELLYSESDVQDQ